jgi:beta-lactamase class A
MLVRDLGGGDALNAFAAAAGARSAQLYDPNLVTADDLAAVLVAEASGRLGGQAAQQWLYPLLSNTVESAGIPAGVPQGTQVMHKTGWYDTVENDAALVVGPQGGYVLVICSDGDASDAGWQLLASISARVWQYESQRLP